MEIRTDSLGPGSEVDVPGLPGIKIVILGTKEGQAKIGIKGPRHIPVWRKEIWDKIQAQKEQGDGHGGVEKDMA